MFDDTKHFQQTQLIVVRNPFDRADREVVTIPNDGNTPLDVLVGEYIPADLEVDISINGFIIARESWKTTNLMLGDQVVVMPRIQGDDFNPLAAVLMIAVTVAAPYLAAAMLGESMTAAGIAAALSTYGVGFGMIVAGISMVGSMVVGALTAPAKPSLPGASSYDNSPTYSWTPMTTQEPGAPVSRAYGLVKLYGNVIAGFIENTGDSGNEQTANMLIELGLGPYEDLYDFKINDQPISQYDGVTVEERLGKINQPVITAFNDTRANHSIGAKVVKGTPVTRDTVGTDFAALEVVITCPQGLWHANDQGGMDPLSADIKVELSTDAGSSWKNAIQSGSTYNVTSAGYWSAGYWVDGGYSGESAMSPTWAESAAGSTTQSDHSEGDPYGSVTGTTYNAIWRWIASPVTRAVTTTDQLHLTGSSTTAIRKTIRIDGITPGTACKVRVTNLTDDQTTSRYGDDVYFAELNEVLLDDFQYPRSVLVGIKALATNQLSGSLRFSCLAKTSKIWVGGPPSSGGAFQYSNNPAWVCYDILTQPVTDDGGSIIRYDGRDPSSIILQTFLDWAGFCNTSVNDGHGGTEARCQFDGVYDTESDTWTAALNVAATARATLAIRGTRIAAIYDDVRSTPSQIFTVANSSDFSEVFLPMTGRASVIEVEFSNKDLDYTRDVAPIINSDVAAASGVATPARKAMLGVTRSSQAWREANVMLARNQYLQRTGELSVDIDSLASTVGDRVDLQVDVTQWGEGGRAISGTINTIVLDHPVTLDVGKSYEVTIRHSGSTDVIETRAITTDAGTVSSITVGSSFSEVVHNLDVWAIGEVGKATKPFLITSISRDSDQRAKLTLIEYNASIYGLDGGIPAQQTPNISASVGFSDIINVSVSENLAPSADGTAYVVVSLQFGFSDRSKARAVYATARPSGSSTWGQNTRSVRVLGNVAQFDGLEDGADYIFTLASENFLGQVQPQSAAAVITYSVIGRTGQNSGVGIVGAPPTPTGLTTTPGLFTVNLTWSVDVGGRRDIAYTEVWAAAANDRSAASRINSEPWPSTAYKHIGLAPVLPWYYWVRTADRSGNLSGWHPSGATAGVQGLPSADPHNLLVQLNQALGLTEMMADLATPIALLTQPGNLAAFGGMVAPPSAVASPSPIVLGAQAAAESVLNLLVKADALKAQAQKDKWILDATSTVDAVTGKVTLLATAALTTDVEAHLIETDLTLDGMAGSIISHTSTLGLYGTRITNAETNITQLEGDITLKASSVYVDTTIATALGSLDPANVATMTQLGAEGLLSALVDSDGTHNETLNAAVRVAIAETTLTTHADAISAEAVARTVLFAQVASNASAISSEAVTRANADSAEAALRVALASTVAGHTAAISSEAVTRANADSAEAALRVALATAVNDPATGLSTRAAASDVVTLQSITGNGTSGNSALASRASNLEASVNNGTTGLATRASQSDVTSLQVLTGDSSHGNVALGSSVTTLSSSVSTAQSTANTANSNAGAAQTTANTGVTNAATAQSTANTAASTASAAATAVSTVQARLDSGDYAAVKTESSASASAITGIKAKYALKVDVNGHVTGFEIINGGTSGDFVILADKFLICKPDGTGTPIPVLSLGTVGGVTALGLAGNLIVDGTIVTGGIAGNAITQPINAYTAGSVGFSGPAGWTTVQSITVTTDGSPVFLMGQTTASMTPGGVLIAVLTRVGSASAYFTQAMADIADTKNTNIVVMGMDTPPAGTYVYQLNIGCSYGSTGIANSRNLFLTTLKR